MDGASSNMDMENFVNYQGTNWNYFEMRPLNLSSLPTTRVVPTPPSSPNNNLCIIQEENSLNNQYQQHLQEQQQFLQQQCDMHNAQHSNHPQICLTDVQGSEITLVALSDSSRGSDDSLDTNNSSNNLSINSTRCVSSYHEFLITEPSEDMPSITRGVGRKASLENENKGMGPGAASTSGPSQVHIPSTSTVRVEPDQYARRGSDKSLGFSDDSLSNDSNHSPAQEISGSSGFKSGNEERLSPDSLSESRASSDEYYELPLPNECSNLDVPSILEIVKKQINSKLPPKGFIVSRTDDASSSSDNSQASQQLPVDISNLNLEYSGGLQIELQICDRHNECNNLTNEAGNSAGAAKGIKLRRISGDQNEYGKLCQQLLTSLTV
jgi:serine/threonine-protein kinase SIK3